MLVLDLSAAFLCGALTKFVSLKLDSSQTLVNPLYQSETQVYVSYIALISHNLPAHIYNVSDQCLSYVSLIGLQEPARSKPYLVVCGYTQWKKRVSLLLEKEY